MAEFLQMPRLGQSMEEGTVLQWYKREGDTVKAGEPLLEVMSDKANFEVEATKDGVLRKILVDADGTVPVSTPIAIVGSATEPIDTLLESATQASDGGYKQAANKLASPIPAISSQTAPAAGSSAISPRARRLAEEHAISISTLGLSGSGPGGRIIERDIISYLGRQKTLESPTASQPARMTPLAARIAGDLGVDVRQLGAGASGVKLRADDVRKVAGTATSKAGPGEPAVAEVIPFRGLRKIVAGNVAKSRQNAPHVTLTLEVDMTNAVELQARLRPEIERDFGAKLTATDLLVKASARALEAHPLCNAALAGDEIRVYGDKNIGVAVATENGLIVPVVRNADRKRLGETCAELKSLVDRCRSGKQSQADLSGGTFTITNLGAFGIDVFDPIIVSPQSCILGVGRIADKVVAANKAIEIRPMMNLCLSFDHRVLDGVPAARFLQRMKELMESPDLIFV